MNARTTLLLACSLTLLASCASAPPPAPPPAKKYSMPDSSYLTEAARLKIRARMGSHQAAMSGLFNSLLVLDRESARTYASAIASQPKLEQDPNLPKDERIPDRVIQLQAELHQKAEALIRLVERDERIQTQELAAGLSNLATVCVTCHSEYLYGEQ